MLELVYFEHRPNALSVAKAAGINTFLVDWEYRGKHSRQENAGTEVDPGTLADLEAAVSFKDSSVYCRINEYGPWTREEVENAIEAGAKCLLLPMVKQVDEVESYLKMVNGRCGAGILIETVDATKNSKQLAKLLIDTVYVGLNDLAIDRRSTTIFEAVADGTVERMRETFTHGRFGFGGVTVVDEGDPIPCKMLLQEMQRLDCHFSFCRRSFKRDIANKNIAKEVMYLRQYWMKLEQRSKFQREVDHRALVDLIFQICPSKAAFQ